MLMKIKNYFNLPKATSLKPLLVTGSHRSGSTWIGRVIEQSNDFVYVDEPLQLSNTSSPVSNVKYWFPYIKSDDKQIIEDLLAIKESASIEQKRALFKDPMAFFSIDTFIDELESDILISVRHPAGFVSSIKRLGWTHDFNHFLEQEELMDSYLYPFRNEIRDFSKNKKDIVDQGILLWNIINLNTLKFKQKYPQIYIVRHEDLSLDPVNEFQKIFSYFDIKFTSQVQNYIQKTTSQANTSEAIDNAVHQLHRNSKANIDNYKNRLTTGEISRIRNGTEMVSHVFYDREWWED